MLVLNQRRSQINPSWVTAENQCRASPQSMANTPPFVIWSGSAWRNSWVNCEERPGYCNFNLCRTFLFEWFLKIQNQKLLNLPILLNINHQQSSHLLSPGGADSKSSPLPAPPAKGACLQGSQRTRGAPERCTGHCERAQLCADATAATANDNPSGNSERSERIKCTHRAKCRDGMAAACQREIWWRSSPGGWDETCRFAWQLLRERSKFSILQENPVLNDFCEVHAFLAEHSLEQYAVSSVSSVVQLESSYNKLHLFRMGESWGCLAREWSWRTWELDGGIASCFSRAAGAGPVDVCL